MNGRLSLAAFAAIACSSLTACGIQTLDVGSGFPPDQAAFLRDIQEPDLKGQTAWVTNDMSKEKRAEYVALGQQVCTAIASGVSLRDIDVALTKQFPKAPEVMSLVLAAQKSLCPSA